MYTIVIQYTKAQHTLLNIYGNSVIIIFFRIITNIHTLTKTHIIKGTGILSQFLFLMEKHILYAKITVSQNFFFSKLSFK